MKTKKSSLDLEIKKSVKLVDSFQLKDGVGNQTAEGLKSSEKRGIRGIISKGISHKREERYRITGSRRIFLRTRDTTGMSVGMRKGGKGINSY